MAITVKRMPEWFQNLEEWTLKVNYLGQLRHPNLLKLMGYCYEDDSRFLVYEFMPRGSLEMNLLGYEFMPRESRPNQILSWETRVNVAIGVARALSFLHDRKPPVIHEFVKASTILLDEDFNAKLEIFSDEPEFNAVFNRVDTPHPNLLSNFQRPYRSPEYILTGNETAKGNVYSFGVVLLQLLSGRRASDQGRIPGEQNLVDYAKPLLSHKRKLLSIMDPILGKQYSIQGARMLAAIALGCLSPMPKQRPSMTMVLDSLEKLLRK